MSLSSKTLFVRNLPYSTTDAQLEQAFSRHGALKACFTVKEKGSRDSCRGFGYVTYENKEDADKAKSLIKVFGGRPVQIVFARQREPDKKKRTEIEEDERVEKGEGGNKEKTESEEEGGDNDKGDGSDSEEREGESEEESDSEDDYEARTAKRSEVRGGGGKNKRKAERGDAKFDIGRVVVVGNLPGETELERLKKTCEQVGKVETLNFPIPEQDTPTAYVTYSTHKEARLAVSRLNGVSFGLSEAKLSVQLLSREGKKVSKKALKKSRLIVRNLSFKCSEADVRKVFGKYGELVEVHIPRKPNGHMLGYAFVQFTSYFAAKNALEAVNMTEVKGRPVAVDWVVPKDQYEHSMQREGAGEEEREEREEEGMADILSETSDAEIDQSDLESHDSDAEAQDSDDESHDSDDESHDIEATADDSDMESHDSEMISDDGDEIEDDDEEPHPLKREDTSDQKTIFIRNLPLNTEHKELKQLFYKFGRVRYCRVMLNPDTGLCTGSAFVQFKDAQSAKNCLTAAAKEDQGLSYCGHHLDLTFALSREEVEQVCRGRDERTKGEDKRNLYLSKEGVIQPGSEAAALLTKTELARRMKVYSQKKSKLTSPHCFVSKTRLSVHNLPINLDEQRMKRVFHKAAGDSEAKISQIKILRSSDRVNSKGIGRSLGYGFIEFTTHEAALSALRATNNNPAIFGEKRRLIVEFAVEDSRAIKLREKRKLRQMKPTSIGQATDNGSVEGQRPLTKRQKWMLKCRAKRLRRKERKNAPASSLDQKEKEVKKSVDKPMKRKVTFELPKVEKHKHQVIPGASLVTSANGDHKLVGLSSKKVKSSSQITNSTDVGLSKKSSRKRKRKGAESNEEEAFAKMVDKYRRKLQHTDT